MKVIIIDDDMASLSSFIVAFAKEYTLEYKFFMDNPLDTLTYIVDHDVDGVFLGNTNSFMNCCELAKKLLEIRKDLQLVFLFPMENMIPDLEFQENILGFCAKPLKETEILNYIRRMKEKKKLRIHTFGSFEVFLNQRLVQFKSAKSKELFALLITYNGKSLSMSDAICHLWPDKDVERAKRLYRDAVWKLRKTFTEYDLFSIIDFKRAQLFLHKGNIECDYWEYMKGSHVNYAGVFLPSYDWSIEVQSELDSIKIKREYKI